MTYPSCQNYITAIKEPKLIKANVLNGGRVLTYNGEPIMYAGGFCAVFPFILSSSKKVAVRCWTAHVPDADKRSNLIASELKRSGLPYFVEFDYISDGIYISDGNAMSHGVFPIVIMDWVDAAPLKEYINNHIHDKKLISNLAEQFKLMVCDLHKKSFSHGDLQHGNIMVTNDGKIMLVDYDSMYVPGLENISDEIKGLAGYQHPGRINLTYLSPKADYFSELIVYTSLIALAEYPELWKQLNIHKTETLLFTQEDIERPGRSKILKKLKENSDLRPLVIAIEKALGKRNIEDLLPLEDAILPNSSHIANTIKQKWNNKPSGVKKEAQIDTNAMTEKWKKKQNTSPNIEKDIDITSTTSKW